MNTCNCRCKFISVFKSSFLNCRLPLSVLVLIAIQVWPFTIDTCLTITGVPTEPQWFWMTGKMIPLFSHFFEQIHRIVSPDSSLSLWQCISFILLQLVFSFTLLSLSLFSSCSFFLLPFLSHYLSYQICHFHYFLSFSFSVFFLYSLVLFLFKLLSSSHIQAFTPIVTDDFHQISSNNKSSLLLQSSMYSSWF